MRTLLAMLVACVFGCVPSPSGVGLAQPAVTGEERAVIEGKVRAHLKLPSGAALSPAEFARVTELNLRNEPVTDASAAWLSDPGTCLKGLTTLYLCGTQVTDAGVRDLARANSGLKRLTALDLRSTQ